MSNNIRLISIRNAYQEKIKCERRTGMAKTNSSYMMTVDDVAQELGVSRQKGYCIIRQLNEELAAAGYMTVQAKVPRTYWSERFYSGKRNAV